MNINNARRIPYIIDRLQELEDSPATAITDGIVVTARDANEFPTEIDYYSPKFYTRVFFNTNANAGYWIKLQKINCKTDVTSIGEAAFYFCPVVDVDLTKITSMKTGLQNAKGIINLDMPLLTTLEGNSNFNAMTALETVNLPKIRRLIGNYNFADDTALKNVTIGSIGFGLTEAPSNNTFQRCTQSTLTITVFTTAALSDTILANLRNGATNATIKIYAAEDTTYDGDSYAAGELLLTSEV